MAEVAPGAPSFGFGTIARMDRNGDRPAPVTLRLAQRSDAIALAEMSRDWIETGLGWTYRPERVRRLITHRETQTLVALDASAGIVGFAVMQFGEERAHLVLMAVAPTARRKGIGQALLQWLLESAVAAGMASVHLELRAGNGDAMAFYGQQGFAQTLMLSGYYQGREHAVRMVRVLRPPQQQPALDDDWWSALRR